MIELQTSVKQDNTTRTRTPKPGYLNLSISIVNGAAVIGENCCVHPANGTHITVHVVVNQYC